MTPEAQARLSIDQRLALAGWRVQDHKALNLGAGLGVAVREYPTAAGPADYVLLVDRQPVGVIEAKKDESLDVFWLKDSSLENLDDLPPPDVLQQEIVDHLEAALTAFRDVAAALPKTAAV